MKHNHKIDALFKELARLRKARYDHYEKGETIHGRACRMAIGDIVYQLNQFGFKEEI